MYKISTLFIFAQFLCGVTNVHAAGGKSDLQIIETLPRTLTVQTLPDEHAIETTQMELIRLEEERAESLRQIEDVMHEEARLFGAEFVVVDSIMDSHTMTGQYGPGQRKIMKAGDATSLRYDFTVLLAKNVQSGGGVYAPLLSTSGTVFRNEEGDYSHLVEFRQFEFDQFLPKSLGEYRKLHPDDLQKYMMHDVTILEFATNVLEKLGIPYKIRLNHREMVWYMAKFLNIDALTFQNVLDILDKTTNKKRRILDFISELAIRQTSPSLPGELICLLWWSIQLQDDPLGLISLLLNQYEGLEQVKKPLLELQTIISLLLPETAKHIIFDLTLARGANYYEGAIFEIFMPTQRGVGIGALFGGGRFRIKDPVTGAESFGVGGAFGIDRVFLALKELQIRKAREKRIAVIGENAISLLDWARALRTQGFSVSTFFISDEDIHLRSFELMFPII